MTAYSVGGALFRSEHQTGPEYSGTIEIRPQDFKVDGNGVIKIALACWPKTSKAGKPYLQLSQDKKAKQGQGGGPSGGSSPFKPRQPMPQGRNDMDDGGDIPF